MTKRSTRPRLLNEVLQAIVDVGESQGCTVKKILKQVEESIIWKNIKPKPRNVVTQVHKAVKHGIQSGLLKQQYGKVYLIVKKKKPVASKPPVNKRKKTFHERLRKVAENRRRNPVAKKKTRKREVKPSRHFSNKHKREDTDSSSVNYSTYYPSSISKSVVSTDSYSEKRRSKRIQKRKAAHRRRKVEKPATDNPGSHASSPSRRTSKNCIEPPRDDEDNNANPADEANNVCGNPECLCNPDRM